MTDSVLAHRVWVVLRFLICWLAAIALMIAGFVVPLIVVWRWVGEAVITASGPPSHDLSDIGPVLFGFFVGGFAGVLAGAIGMTLAGVPALALVGKSGVFNRFRRRNSEYDDQESWQPQARQDDLLNSHWPDETPHGAPYPPTNHGDEG